MMTEARHGRTERAYRPGSRKPTRAPPHLTDRPVLPTGATGLQEAIIRRDVIRAGSVTNMLTVNPDRPLVMATVNRHIRASAMTVGHKATVRSGQEGHTASGPMSGSSAFPAESQPDIPAPVKMACA